MTRIYNFNVVKTFYFKNLTKHNLKTKENNLVNTILSEKQVQFKQVDMKKNQSKENYL